MTDRLRVMTLNLLTVAEAGGLERQDVVRRALPDLRPDVIALQEVTRGPDADQARHLLGPGFAVVDLPGRAQPGECLACRWPVGQIAALDVPAGDRRASAVAVEVLVPPPIGPLLVVHHRAAFELDLEHVREEQAVATARFVDELVSGRPDLPVVLLGDLNAAPDAASVRFLTGKQSLRGTSTRYEDAWAVVHPDEPGHTFSPANPLVRLGRMPLEAGAASTTSWSAAVRTARCWTSSTAASSSTGPWTACGPATTSGCSPTSPAPTTRRAPGPDRPAPASGRA